MAFKMNPKSPLLMKAMGISPAKNMNKGYGPAKTSSPAKQRTGGLGNEEAKDETQNIRGRGEMLPREDKVRNMSKELKRVKKKKVSAIESEPIQKASVKKTKVEKKVEKKELTPKQKAMEELRKAQSDNEVANIEKETSKVQKNSTKKRKQSARKKSQAERRAEKTRVLEERIKRRKARRSPAKQKLHSTMKSGSSMTAAEKKAMKDKSVFGPDGKNVAKPPKNTKKSKYDKSPTKQTAKQKANLPKEIVNAIAAKQGKSPAKQVDKAGQRIIKQGEKAEAAYKAGDVKKGNKHKVRAKRMSGRYDAKRLKNNLKGGVRNNNAQG